MTLRRQARLEAAHRTEERIAELEKRLEDLDWGVYSDLDFEDWKEDRSDLCDNERDE